MSNKSVLSRIEQAEATLKARSIFAQDCICFPEKEQPFFCSSFEIPIAARVKCPLHGNRFKQPRLHLYVPSWLAEKEPARRERLSPQYRKAWEAGFPSEVWPAVPKQEIEDGKIFFRLKDGTKLLVG
jgi:hypothetical protein